MFKSITPISFEKPLYKVETKEGIYVLKFSDRLYESRFLEILSKDPECNPYIVCMFKSFEISHDQAYQLTYGHIGSPKKRPKVMRYIEGKLTELNLFHPSDKYTAILLEAMDGDVKYLKNSGFFLKYNQEIIKLLIFGLLGLAYIHSKNICHQDIFDENILYKNTSKGLVYKLSDFGESCGEPVDICIDLEDSKKEDVKSLGETIFEIMTGKNFSDEEDIDDRNEFLKTFTIPKDWSLNIKKIFGIVKDMVLSNYTDAEEVLRVLNYNYININSK